MKIINPHEVLDSELTSNIPITETLWTAGTYNPGDQRYWTATSFELYECLITTTDQPDVGAAKTTPTWKKLGRVNRWAAFDEIIGSVTTSTGTTVDMTVDTDNIINSVAMFKLSGETVQVIVNNTSEGVVYDETVNLVDTSTVSDWYTYFFEPIVQREDVVLTDLPQYGANTTVQVIVTKAATGASIGELVLGFLTDIGYTQQNSTFGTTDYSRKQTDEDGRVTVDERPFAKKGNYLVQVEPGRIAGIQRLINNLLAKPVVWIGEEDQEFQIIYGFLKSLDFPLPNNALIPYSLQVEGLV